MEIFSNAQLRAVLADVNQEVCEEVIDKALDALKEWIDMIVYSSPNRGSYERTMQFEERAWDTLKQKLNAYVAQSELFYNPTLFMPVDNEASPGAHEQADKLADLIIRGYNAYGKAEFPVPPRDYWGAFKTQLNNEWDNWVKSAYRKRGLQVY